MSIADYRGTEMDLDFLTEEEQRLVRSAINADIGRIRKNTSIGLIVSIVFVMYIMCLAFFMHDLLLFVGGMLSSILFICMYVSRSRITDLYAVIQKLAKQLAESQNSG